MRKRVLSAQLSHETNTFSNVPTTLASFAGRVLIYGENVARKFEGTQTELGAHLDAATQYDWELVQPFAAHATPAGRVEDTVIEHFLGALLTSIQRGVDGVILALHGSMVSESQQDVEGYLLSRLRAVLGPETPIMVTLDMHANVTQEMAKHANAIIGYRTYPHVDQYDVAAQACALLDRTFSGQCAAPRVHVFKPPLLDGCDHGRTNNPAGPMPYLLKKAHQSLEQAAGIDSIAVFAGFPWSDIHEAGPSIVVTGMVDRDQASDAVTELNADLWRMRAQTSLKLVSAVRVAEIATEFAFHWKPGDKPLVIADFTDNPGHGAPGDGIALARAMLDAGTTRAAFACICDPAAVQACFDAGPGATLQLSIGACKYPDIYGEPLTTTVEVLSCSAGKLVLDGPMRRGTPLSLGKSAVVGIDGIRLVLSTNNLQTQDLQYFKSQGIDPAHCAVLVVKSQQHFRAAFEPIAAEIVLADSGGFVSPDLSRLPYRHVRRPVWPLDANIAESCEPNPT
jgi:microcystin degradation protein MlrC